MEYFRQRFEDELNDEGEIAVRGSSWPRQVVFNKMDPEAYDNAFVGWVSQARAEAKDQARDFLTRTGSLRRFQTLYNRVANGSAIPVVGAGLSVPAGFELWGSFLETLGGDDGSLVTSVQESVGRGGYEEAAQRLYDAIGANRMAEAIHNQLGSHRRATAGAVRLLPEVFQSEVLTTNFDYVLPNVYLSANRAFAGTFSGTMLREAPARMGNDPHVLLRLHGEGDSPEGRILTQAEYEAAYGQGRPLSALISAIVTNKSLLFIGCSLGSDRIVQALREIRAAAAISPTRHYAFLPWPSSAQRQARAAELADAEIYPIYYPADDHDRSIEYLLIALMDGGLDE